MSALKRFVIPRENLKIRILEENQKLLETIRSSADDKTVLPDARNYYSEILFPEAPENRPYTISSIVLSADGKMAFADDPQGPLVAQKNFLDPDGAQCDFWVLNLLRAYSDGVIVGANTLNKEPGVTSHVYDRELDRQRRDVLKKKENPVNIIVSFDGRDIPFRHDNFSVDPAERYQSVIATSPEGYEFIRENSPLKHRLVGPFSNRQEVDAWKFETLYKDFDVFPVIVTGQGRTPDTGLLMYALRKMGLKRLCIESPTYCASLLKLKMLDEWFINYSMLYVGGSITPGSGMPFSVNEHPHSQLVSLGIHGSSFLYSRQKILYGIHEIKV